MINPKDIAGEQEEEEEKDFTCYPHWRQIGMEVWTADN